MPVLPLSLHCSFLNPDLALFILTEVQACIASSRVKRSCEGLLLVMHDLYPIR